MENGWLRTSPTEIPYFIKLHLVYVVIKTPHKMLHARAGWNKHEKM